MPIQTPQWTDFLICPVCENGFELKTRLPISLACGHSICKTCLANLQRNVCPFDQVIVITLTKVIMKSDNINQNSHVTFDRCFVFVYNEDHCDHINQRRHETE